MLTSTTQALLQVQPILYALDGLHATAWKMRAHPNLVMPNFAAQHARQMRQAGVLLRILRLDLPRDAANDEPRAGADLCAPPVSPCGLLRGSLAVGRAFFPRAGAAGHLPMLRPSRIARKARAGRFVPCAV